MNREHFYDDWEHRLKRESYLREVLPPERFDLLWRVKIYMDRFSVDIDDIARKCFLLEKYYKKKSMPQDFIESFDKLKKEYLYEEDLEMVITSIYYLIVYCQIEAAQRNSYVQALRVGIDKIVKTKSVGCNFGYLKKQEFLVEDILHEFSEKLFI